MLSLCARPISTPRLNPLLDLHLVPINLVIYKGSMTNVNLEDGFTLRCFQRLSVLNIATSDAPDGTTGTLEVYPLRSSRTRSEPSQHSTPATDRRPTIMLHSLTRRHAISGILCMSPCSSDYIFTPHRRIRYSL